MPSPLRRHKQAVGAFNRPQAAVVDQFNSQQRQKEAADGGGGGKLLEEVGRNVVPPRRSEIDVIKIRRLNNQSHPIANLGASFKEKRDSSQRDGGS